MQMRRIHGRLAAGGGTAGPTPVATLAAMRAAALAVLMACVGCTPSDRSGARYETAAVTRGDVEREVTASGSLSAVVSVDVGSQVSGKVASLKLDFNSPVR